MYIVRPKKKFGQHFLKNKTIANRISKGIDTAVCPRVLEIGPGMGILTSELLQQNIQLKVIEIDRESVQYLKEKALIPEENIIEGDFLHTNITDIFNEQEFSIIGNFPYNISSQIVFKAIENRTFVPQLSGMFQREMARRICSPKGSKEYGIISVLTQAFYDTTYNFTVHEQEFNPPPKVKSGVITLTRKANHTLPCNEKLFFTVVKTAFNQRRKTLDNSLKKLLIGNKLDKKFGTLRPEQLSVLDFIEITNYVNKKQKGGSHAI
ncbi:MAG: 16S rRNA (adenine(1518)-N(6)/adenine(1519)-N(6))-dimethyltransferase RsmA [Bacteroidales bacterium]|nr:16S rRNA (adenine(1518)-N(6)/adenine(1519)-N(6))-dimethyltransferase RsmA [Bacteroidales bacterium]